MTLRHHLLLSGLLAAGCTTSTKHDNDASSSVLDDCDRYKRALLGHRVCDPGATPPTINGNYDAYTCLDDLADVPTGGRATLSGCAAYLDDLSSDGGCFVPLGQEREVCKAGILVLRDGGVTLTPSDSVGQRCFPEQVPETGFHGREVYIESASSQCETGSCIVYELDGDPRADCDPTAGNGALCARPQDVEDRIYCTCQCFGGDAGAQPPSSGVLGSAAICGCPDGFDCVDVVDVAYCIREGTH